MSATVAAWGRDICKRDEHPSNAFSAIEVMVPRKATSERAVQPSNDDSPIVVTDCEKVTFVNVEQSLKAFLGIVTISPDINNTLHPSNTLLPIVAKGGWSVISLNDVQPSNDESHICKTVCEIATLVSDLQSLKASFGMSVNSPDIVNVVQPSNALYPMVVTDAGIDISFNALQPSNDESPIFSIDDGEGIISFVNVVQSLNARSGIAVMLPVICNVVQPKNAFCLIVINDEGNDISDRFWHPSNDDSPIVVTVCGNTTLVREEHSLKELSGMLSMFPTMVNDVQPSKAFAPINVTEDGIDTVANAGHPANDDSPIVVTVDGIVTFSNLVHPLKALFGMASISPDITNVLHPSKAFAPIVVTDLGIDTSTKATQPSNDESPIVVMSDWKTILSSVVQSLKEMFGMALIVPVIVNDLHPSKALEPIVVTEEGIDILESDVQPSKEKSPIFCTVSGISILVNVVQFLNELFGSTSMLPSIVNDWHPSNALFPIAVTDEGIDTSTKDVHPSKDESPIVCTVPGITILLNAVHPLKELAGITFIVPKSASDITPSNALLPIVVTVDGIDILFNDLHPSNDDSPIFDTVDGITIDINVVQSLNRLLGISAMFPEISSWVIPSNALLPTWVIGVVRDISFNDEHPSNTESPIAVTVGGITILFNVLQSLNNLLGRFTISPEIIKDDTPKKALFPIVFNDVGIWISAKLTHFSKDESPILAIPDVITTLFNVLHPLNASLGMAVMSPFIVNFLIPKNAFCLISIKEDGNDTSTNSVHPSKTEFSIDSIGDDITTFVSVVQSLNELFGIFLVSPVKVISVQPSNELVPTDSKDDGIDISFNAVHPLKTKLPIETIDGGIIILVNDVQFSKTESLIFWTPLFIVTSAKRLHPLKSESLITVTEGGIIIAVNEVQSSNVLSPIEFTESGISIFSNALHPWNAKLPIEITYLDIDTDFSKTQSSNDESPIEFTEFGIDMSVNAEQPLNKQLEICLIEYGKDMLVRAVHPLNALSPIVSTDDGILIVVNLEQPSRAESPIETTHDGITIFANSEQPFNAQLSITVTEEGSVISVIFERPQKTKLFKEVILEGKFNWVNSVQPLKA